MNTEAKLIAYYMAGVISAKDGRGRTPTIAMLTAQAVRAVGEAIAERARQ